MADKHAHMDVQLFRTQDNRLAVRTVYGEIVVLDADGLGYLDLGLAFSEKKHCNCDDHVWEPILGGRDGEG